MYPAIPTEQWQNRNGEGQYLYMFFHRDPYSGQYQGPDGKRKVYVGANPKHIAEARRLAFNRRCYEELCAAARQLKQWLEFQELQIERLVKESGHYPVFVGTPIAGQAAEESPK